MDGVSSVRLSRASFWRADGAGFPPVGLDSSPFGGGNVVGELMRTDYRPVMHLSRGESVMCIMRSLFVIETQGAEWGGFWLPWGFDGMHYQFALSNLY